ncbi:MAG: TonB-dependent receptor, partial [Bacteroidetes bacterium]
LTLYGGVRYAVYKSLGPDEVLLYGENLPMEPGNVNDTLYFGQNEVSSTYTSLEPRFAVNLMMGPNNSLKFSYNRVRQFMFMLSNTIAISPTDQWKLCDYHIKPPFVDQYSLGYYLDIPRGSVSTSLEVYYKSISDVVDYKDGASFISTPHTETLTLQGDQEAYGVEAMIKKGAGKVSGWLAYSYSRSFMQIRSPFPGESINEGNPYSSNYDRPHSLSVVANFKLNRRLSFSSNVVYMTGRPATFPVSIYYVEGMQYVDYSDRNSYRIPDYFRLDFSLNLEGNLKERKLFHSYWMLNFYNVTGRQNAYSVYFQNEDGAINGYKLSIFGQMIVTLSWNFKLGNYASE